MNKILAFFDSMLKSPDGDISYKRVIGTLGFLVIAISLVISVLSKRTITPSPELINSLEYITISCIFGTAIEKFKKG